MELGPPNHPRGSVHMSSDSLLFYVNGSRVVIDHPDPTTLLVDWLRSDSIGLTGTKLSCGEGGCGACTVMLARWEPGSKGVSETAINSCLRPLVSLDGASVITTEGIGSTREKLDPVQYRLAANNGSQCGYCSPGFVMNMFTFLREHPKPAQREIEDLFDGHICRCTGFRPILEGMRSFAGDFRKDQYYHSNHKCFAGVPIEQHLSGPRPELEFPKELIEYAKQRRSLTFSGRGYQWFKPATLEEAQKLKAQHGGNSRNVKLVAGNTTIGIFNWQVQDPHVLIDIAQLPGILGFASGENGLTIGAGEPLQRVIEELAKHQKDAGYAAMRTHLLEVANLQVRNIGSIAGNVMMTRAQAETPQPFPSDVYMLLALLDASITIAGAGGTATYPIMELPAPKQLPDDAIAVSIHVPRTKGGDIVETFKIPARGQDSHALVNAGFIVSLDRKGNVAGARIFYGGLGNMPSRMTRTEALLVGRAWDDDTLQAALDSIAAEVQAVIRPIPGTGFLPPGYRESLTETLFYKFFLHVALARFPKRVQQVNGSGGEVYVRPLSGATSDITDYPAEAPLGEPILKTTAFIQASGEQKYAQDLPLPPHGYDAAFVQSQRARATFRYKGSKSEVLQKAQETFPGTIAIIDVEDIPGATHVGIGNDDPIFAVDHEVICWGQPIALLVAKDRWTAERAAWYVETELIEYVEDPKQKPVFTIEEALALPNREGLFKDEPPGNVHIPFIRRKGSDETWLRDPSGPMKGCLSVSGMQQSEGQSHFYMETQACMAIPGDQGTITLYSTTQQGSGVQAATAAALGITNSSVIVLQRPLGGAFGGKQARPSVLSPTAAIAAWKLGRPVRYVLDRSSDMEIIGKRHPFRGEFHATFTRSGLLKGYRVQLYSNGGSTYDTSFPVLDVSQQNADGAYYAPTWECRGDVAHTNNASNTAMRSFGATQSVLVMEETIEKIARAIGKQPEHVRWENLYRTNQTSPFGERLDANIRELWKKLMKSSDFDRRRARVEKFNKQNRWRKRGLSMIPLKYGIGFQPRLLDQGAALVMAYAPDGSVTLQHGGAEAGQGIDTKMQQIAAATLGIPMSMIRIAQTTTQNMPNASPTAASSGSDLYGGATHLAALKLRKRLEEYCRKNKVKGWKKDWAKLWPSIVSGAYSARVDLIAEALYSTPLIQNVVGVHSQGRAFLYFIFAAAASEVEIDVLTGEVQVLRADILYDAGRSLNSCLDLGQIEGSYVQGLGMMTSEQLMYEPDGRLYSNGTWEYKPPTTKSIPIDFRVTISRGGHPTKSDSAVAGSRALGEPPFVLSTSAFFAIKHAILAARSDQGDDSWFEMSTPATVGRIQNACRINRDKLRL